MSIIMAHISITYWNSPTHQLLWQSWHVFATTTLPLYQPSHYSITLKAQHSVPSATMNIHGTRHPRVCCSGWHHLSCPLAHLKSLCLRHPAYPLLLHSHHYHYITSTPTSYYFWNPNYPCDQHSIALLLLIIKYFKPHPSPQYMSLCILSKSWPTPSSPNKPLQPPTHIPSRPTPTCQQFPALDYNPSSTSILLLYQKLTNSAITASPVC